MFNKRDMIMLSHFLFEHVEISFFFFTKVKVGDNVDKLSINFYKSTHINFTMTFFNRNG